METASWHKNDAMWLRDAIGQFLLEAGNDVLPTEGNIRRVLTSGLAFAEAGDPCLVGVVGGSLVGFLYWYGAQAYETKDRTLYADGSYIALPYRHKGFGSQLRDAGLTHARAMGYGRVVYHVAFGNLQGMAAYKALGATPTMMQLAQEL